MGIKKIINRLRFHAKAFVSPSVFEGDGLCTIHNAGFLKEEAFVNAYKAGCETMSWGQAPHIEWRLHVILWAAKNALKLDGDFVECGVYKGGFCNAILTGTAFESTKKKYWLFDSFKFHFYTANTAAEEIAYINKKYKKYIDVSYLDEVKSRFANKPVEIVEGLVPIALEKFSASKVSFLSIDMNSTEAEIAALDFFWDKMVLGGIIILDDYAQYAHEKQYQALNDYCTQKGIHILSLPTGQGLIQKI
jgi:O-methyltransferase